MARLSKQTKAAKTKIANRSSGVRGKYNYYKYENEFISDEKIQVLNLNHKYKIWLGAKNSGKTRPVITRQLGLMEKSKYAYALAIKKYKQNATARLSTAITNLSIEMKHKGFSIPDYKRGVDKCERMEQPLHLRQLNQTVEFSSLDDVNAISGIEAPNLGKFVSVHIEEPVEVNDNNVPSYEDFWRDMQIIENSVSRSNTRHARQFKSQVVNPDFHFTLNCWDEHPLVVEAEKVFPEAEFMEECLGIENWETLDSGILEAQWEDIKKSLQKNHTSVRTLEVDDKAFIRLTMFANPMWIDELSIYNPKKALSREEQLEVFWNKMKVAILSRDYTYLAINLGLRYIPDNNNKTYNLDNLEVGDSIKEIKDGWELVGQSQGIDIDMRRLFANVGVVICRKRMHPLDPKYTYKFFVLPPRSFKAGGNENGTKTAQYRQLLNNMVMNRIGDFGFVNSNPTQPLEFGSYLYIDDNQGVWISEFTDLMSSLYVSKARKHGDYDILSRQGLVNLLINKGMLFIDEKCIDLLKSLKQSFSKDGSQKRDESSTLEKLYDWINAMEYALYPFRYIAYY